MRKLIVLVAIIYMTKKAIETVHLTLNSRLDQLLKSSKAESLAEGREIGRKER